MSYNLILCLSGGWWRAEQQCSSSGCGRGSSPASGCCSGSDRRCLCNVEAKVSDRTVMLLYRRRTEEVVGVMYQVSSEERASPEGPA